MPILRYFISGTNKDLLEEVATDLEGWGLVKEMLGWHQRENQVFSRQPLYYYEHHYSSHTRFHLTSVIVVEATLAGMEVLSRLPDGWPGRVVLLVANASEVRLWPSAILDRIDSVFWKQEDNFLPALRQVCLTHHLAVCERLARLLRFRRSHQRLPAPCGKELAWPDRSARPTDSQPRCRGCAATSGSGPQPT